VSFSASKRPLLHVRVRAATSQRSVDGNRHECCFRYRVHDQKSRRRVPRVKWKRNKSAHPTKNLSEPSLKGPLLFGVTRFCRQRVQEVPRAGTGLSGNRGTYCSATSSHIAMTTTGRTRHCNEGANESSGSPGGKKCFFTKCSVIGRFNWYPDRHRPVIEPSSFCSPYSCRPAASTIAQPSAEEVGHAIAAETNTPAKAGSKMYADTVTSRRRASSPGHRCRTC
jgi:hypothetical protein